MDNRELPSDSDESDVDFVPEGIECDVVSEADSDEAVAEDASEGSDDEEGNAKKKQPVNGNSKKRSRKQSKKNSTKAKRLRDKSPEEEDEESQEATESKKEISKEEADAIYKKFLDEPEPKPKTSETPKENEEKSKITEIYEYAGEKVTVTKEVAAKSSSLSTPSPLRGRGRGRGRGGVTGGLSAVLGQIGKKNKLGTLEKSKLDWEQFKKKEGIENELQIHNRGKDGYLERQDFLERTDLRQYDIERNARLGRRSNT